MVYLHIYKYSCQARSDKRVRYRTNNYLMLHGHLIWTLTWTSYFKYKLRQLLFVCLAGKPVSKHIYIYTVHLAIRPYSVSMFIYTAI